MLCSICRYLWHDLLQTSPPDRSIDVHSVSPSISHGSVVLCGSSKGPFSMCSTGALLLLCLFFALVSTSQTLPEAFFFSIPWHHIYQDVECSQAPCREVATMCMSWTCLVLLYWSTWREYLLTTYDLPTYMETVTLP